MCTCPQFGGHRSGECRYGDEYEDECYTSDEEEAEQYRVSRSDRRKTYHHPVSREEEELAYRLQRM